MDVQSYVLQRFKEVFKCELGSTVLAAFLVRHKQTHQLTLISMATGTMSLPHSLIQQHPRKLIRDLHAEILAQRGFKRYLKDYQLGAGQLPNLFLVDKKRGKLRINTQKYSLLFYTSSPPCGDCSIEEDKGLYSGARPLIYFKNKQIKDKQKYNKGILRTKPSRLDLPLDKRSLSLCCSDKIMLWNCLGVQGSRLFSRYKPIYIDQMYVEMQPALSRVTVEEGMNLIKRLKLVTTLSQQELDDKLFKVKENGGLTRYTFQVKCHQPQLIQLEKLVHKTKGHSNDSSMVFSLGSPPEQINGKTGLTQGASIKFIQKQIGISQYSSLKLTDPVHQDPEKYAYRIVKQKIKLLFGVWKSDYI